MSANRRAWLAIALALAVAPLASAKQAQPTGRLDRGVVPSAYDLTLRVDPEADRFTGSGDIAVTLARPVDRFWMHARDLEIEGATLTGPDGRPIPATLRQVGPTGLTEVVLDRQAPAGGARLAIRWRGAYQTLPTGLYRTRRDGRAYLVTQFQPISARRVFPGFDQPEFKTPFTLTIETPEREVVVSNAPVATREALPGHWTRTRFATTAPLPTYLLAIAVGPYDVVEGEPAGATPLRAFTAAGRGEEARWGLAKAAELTTWLEDYFGRKMPYPKLDLIGALDFSGGGMENAGAIVYHELRLLTGPASAVDRRRRALTLHAHEIAHQWFGDDVTPAWWDDLWLNEAFATWMQYKAAAAIWPEGDFGRGAQQAGYAAMSIDSLASTRRLREPIAGDASIADAFDSITYLKGASVLAMFERFLGEKTFQAGVRLHLTRHAGGVATSDDFFGAMAEASGSPALVDAFRSFVNEPGVPFVKASLACEKGRRPMLRLTQTRYRPVGSPLAAQPGRWTIPLCVSVYDRGRRERACTLVPATGASLELPVSACPSAVVPNADGAAYVRFSLDELRWKALIARARSLPADEALASVDSLVAGYKAGDVSAPLLVEGLSAFASHPAWDVTGVTIDAFDGLLERLPPAQAATARKRVAALYRARFLAKDRPGDVGEALLRGDLDEVMVLTAADRGARAVFAAEGRRALAGETISPERRGLALTSALLVDGDGAFDRLLAMAHKKDADALSALSRVEAPAQIDALLNRVAAGEFDATQTAAILDGLMSRSRSRPLAWTWLQGHADRVLDLTPEPSRGRRLAQLGRWFCTAGDRAAFNALVLDNAKRTPGYERSLALSNEAIDACTALQARRGSELAAAFR